MKLERDEHSLFASFQSGPQAEAALGALKAAGYTEIQMDRIGQWGYKPDVLEQRPAYRGDESSLVQAVLGPEPLDDESRVLLGATTDASGMSAPDKTDDMPFLVTLVTSNSQVARAVQIIEEHGGRV
ncbi:MAG TPA: hypothetical protein VD973_20845 [Symbiobacteriaceae bacterium]|jgi:hypothetical protein|nr:hypothetical protein [Symbiobacteriaceae bacterium]